MSTSHAQKRNLSLDTKMTDNQNKPLSPPATAAPPETEPDALAVKELLAAMKKTLITVGQNFETLSTQTVRVAELQPAMEASQEVRKIHIQLEEQYHQQTERMAELKTLIRDGIKERINKSLKPRVLELIQAKVQAKVKERVGHELVSQIPSNLKQEISHHKRQILRIRTSLHNSEARRNNSLTTYSSPLTALLRPSPMTNIEPSTPSQLFPNNVRELVSLSPEQLRLLAADYGLITSTGNPPAGANVDTQEELLDKVMAHIGVPYQTVPGSSPLLVAKKTRPD